MQTPKTSPTEQLVTDLSFEEWLKLKTGDRMFLYAIDRIASLEARAKIECREPSCGVVDEEGVSSCVNNKNCGEKTMLSGWRRELQAMRDLKALVEWLERRDMEKKADAGRKRK